MTVRAYASPDAFKQAVEQRLRAGAQTGPRLRRSRQLLVYERFLARIVVVFGDAAILKGGLALELRIKHARATKDIDLRVMGSAQELLAKLQAAGRLDLGDFMTFEVLPDAEHPELLNDGLKYATAFDLFIDAAEDAAAGRRDSERIDAGVLDVLARTGALFSKGGTRLTLAGEGHVRVVLDANTAQVIGTLAGDAPRLEVDSIPPGNVIWSQLPTVEPTSSPLRLSAALVGLDAFFGKWPGDESDQQLTEALRNLQ